MRKSTPIQVIFTRSASVGATIERLVAGSRASIKAALYRLNQPKLARALHNAARRGVSVRLILDREKFRLTPATQRLLSKFAIPYRLMSGRKGRFAKMHHKFAVLDDGTALAGSYNWTRESEDNNYENLIIIRAPEQVKRFGKEFESLWTLAGREASKGSG